MKNFTIDEIIHFDVYGFETTGHFKSYNEDMKTIEIKIIKDDSGVSKIGDIESIHESFLKN